MTPIVLRGLGALALGGLLASACSSSAQQPAPSDPVAQAAPTVTPKVSINAVMVALVDHAGHRLWDVETEGKAPKTDADWEVVQEHAVQIAAAGPAISVGGTGSRDADWVKSPSWHTYAQQMTDAGVAAMTAAQGKNLKALVAANGQLVESCVGCHKEFKPDAPTEGIVHSHLD